MGLELIDSNELSQIQGGSLFGDILMGVGWVVIAAGAGVTLIGGIAVALFVGGVIENTSGN